MDEKKMQEAENLAKEIGELEQMSDVENMIKDNEIKFKLEGRETNYRVRMPIYEEQRELEKFRRVKYLEYIQDDSIKTEKQWKEIYLKKGIDINEMEKKVCLLNRSMQDKLLKLAETNEEIRVEKLKVEIIKIRKEIAETQIEKTDLLSYSLEDLLMVEVSSYITYLVLEKLNEDKQWVKVFESYTECAKTQDSALFNKAFYYSSFLQTQILK